MAIIADDRRSRIAALGFEYEAQPKVRANSCNLCAGETFVTLTHRDRYHYPAEAAGCRRCGLVFLNPVMTAEAYSRFYAGTYRPLVSAFHGRLIDATTIQDEQREYAAERIEFVEPFLAGLRGGSLLDVGGTLRRVHALLRPGGRFFVDIVDLRAAYLRNWSIEDAIKIDHPYYLTQETMSGYLRRAGFDVLRTDFAADHLHVSYLCRPQVPVADARPHPDAVSDLFREVRFV